MVKRLISRYLRDPVMKAVVSLILNFAFAFYNGILGVLSGSRIFLSSGIYYLVLSTTRFITVLTGRKARRRQITPWIGMLLVVLSLTMGAVVFISIRDNTASVYGTITMITIATYTFAKITLAIITAVKQKGSSSPLFRSIRTIRYAEVAVSLLTMQQSMLVSFDGMDAENVSILNILTGTAVCLFILALGIHSIRYSRKEINYGK